MTVVALAFSGLLLAVTAVIRAAGASLVRTPRADALHDAVEGNTNAAIVAELLDDRPKLQPSLGIFLAVLLVLAAIPATWALTRLLDGMALFWALLLLGVVLVLFGDLVPRSIGRSRPRRLAYRWARLLRRAVSLGSAAADLMSDVDLEDEEDEDPVEEAAERELISSVIEFGDTIVREVMVPRPDMVTLDGSATTDDALALVIDAGRSRIPVLGEGIDDVVGTLYARDLLKLYDEDSDAVPCAAIARPAYFVPETKPVPSLLRGMQTNQIHLAIVVDEYGGTAGLVTIEDLLEEIVGEIVDEYDDEAPMVTALDDGGFLVDARMAIDELEDLIGVALPADDWDTVGGLVLGLAGRVPREGEAFDLAEHTFVADRVQGRRISRVRLDSRSR